MLKEGLLAAGAKLVTPLEAELSAGVCVMEAPAAAREALVDRLYYEHGIAGAATGGLRLCPHVYNTREHIDRAIRAVRATRAFWGSARG
jgi:selenocysteine lyase/cysteine desulfurase